MTDHWFSAIYEGTVVQFKFLPQTTKKFNHKCWIITKQDKTIFVDIDLMTFGEYDQLERRINE